MMPAANKQSKPLADPGHKPANPLTEKMKLTLNYDELTNCMRCGFCQPSCPTFKETGLEAASPRGRIALMKSVVDGLMEPDQAFKDQMSLCLGCRACEPVCPADVKYGQLMEQTRYAIAQVNEDRWWVQALRKLMFHHLFPHQNRLRLAGLALKLYQKSGLRMIARGFLKMVSKRISEMEKILPVASYQGVVEQLGTVYPAKGKQVARVGLFRGCIMDVLFTETNLHTVKLLSEAGFEVVIPPAQNCCGALHAHSGEIVGAKELAKANITAFQQADVDYIVSNAGGCGALLIEYDQLLHDEPTWYDEAKRFASKVQDVSQIILEKGVVPSFSAAPQETENGNLTITYQDSCHLRNVMKSGAAPRHLLHRVEHVNVVELADADRCCGSAGIYNLVQPEMASRILDQKMEHVKQTEACYVITSNPGCLLQMKLGVERTNLSQKIKVVHIADFLYERIKQ
jgi:glycolate oxidase iron-sulfur subunit